MQAWVLERGAKRPVARDWPEPAPGPGQVVIEVEAVGLHPVDAETAAGGNAMLLPKSRPFVGGVDVVGTVRTGAPDLPPGTRVFGYTGVPAQGTFAERIAVPRSAVAAAPALPVPTLAALPLPGLCALQALDGWGLRPGSTVLVHGGAGGVGSVAVQVFAARGLRVVATAGASDLDWVRSLGAVEVLDHRAARFEDVVRGVDAVLDTVGGDLPARSARVVAPGGVITSLAALPPPAVLVAAGFAIPLPLRLLLPLPVWWAGRAARAAGVRFAGQVTVPSANRLAALASIADQRGVQTRIDRVVPWTDLAAALDLVASRAARGRVVVQRGG